MFVKKFVSVFLLSLSLSFGSSDVVLTLPKGGYKDRTYNDLEKYRNEIAEVTKVVMSYSGLEPLKHQIQTDYLIDRFNADVDKDNIDKCNTYPERLSAVEQACRDRFLWHYKPYQYAEHKEKQKPLRKYYKAPGGSFKDVNLFIDGVLEEIYGTENLMRTQKPTIMPTSQSGVFSKIMRDRVEKYHKPDFKRKTDVDFDEAIRILWNLAFVEKIQDKYCTGRYACDYEGIKGDYNLRDNVELANEFYYLLNEFNNKVRYKKIAFLEYWKRFNDYAQSGFGLSPELASKIGKSDDRVYPDVKGNVDAELEVEFISSKYREIIHVEGAYVLEIYELYRRFMGVLMYNVAEHVFSENSPSRYRKEELRLFKNANRKNMEKQDIRWLLRGTGTPML